MRLGVGGMGVFGEVGAEVDEVLDAGGPGIGIGVGEQGVGLLPEDVGVGEAAGGIGETQRGKLALGATVGHVADERGGGGGQGAEAVLFVRLGLELDVHIAAVTHGDKGEGVADACGESGQVVEKAGIAVAEDEEIDVEGRGRGGGGAVGGFRISGGANGEDAVAVGSVGDGAEIDELNGVGGGFAEGLPGAAQRLALHFWLAGGAVKMSGGGG